MQIPATQTWVAKRITHILNSNINGKIHIERIAITFFSKAVIKDVYVVDNQNDTILNAQKISLAVSTQSLIRGKIKANRIIIDNAMFYFFDDKLNNTSNIREVFGISKKENKKVKFPRMEANEIRLRGVDFKYINTLPKKIIDKPDQCMKYDDLLVRDIQLLIKDFVIDNGEINCVIKSLSAKEKCGLNLNKFGGIVKLNKKELLIKDLFIIDEFSDVYAKTMIFSYDSPKSLQKYVEEVYMDGDFVDSKVDFRTISKFAPTLINSTLCLNLNGRVFGPVVNLKGEDLFVSSMTNKTSIHIDANIIGLPLIDTTSINANIFSLKTDFRDVSKIIADFGGNQENPSISNLSKDLQYNISGKANGKINNLALLLNINSNNGSAELDIKTTNLIKSKISSISANIKTHNIDLGAIINNNLLGRTTLNTSLTAHLDKKNVLRSNVNISSLVIKKLTINDYPYRNIKAIGALNKNIFDGRVICHDKNLDFIFQGKIGLPKKSNNENMIFNFYIDVPFADLAAMNFVSNKKVSKISFKTMTNISSKSTGDIFGTIDIKNLSYQNNEGKYDIGSVLGVSSFTDDNFSMKLTSPFLTAEFSGSKSISVFLEKFKELVIEDNLSILNKKPKKHNDKITSGDYNFYAITHNTGPFAEIISKGLKIADSTKIELTIDRNDIIDINLMSKNLSLKDKYINGLNINLNNKDSVLSCNVKSKSINAGVLLNNNDIYLKAKDNNIGIKYQFVNDTINKNKIELLSNIEFRRDDFNKLISNITFNKSKMYFQNELWEISESSIQYEDKHISFDNFKICNNKQNLSVNGVLSANPIDTLDIMLDNFDISIFNSFIKLESNLEGKFTGNASIVNMFSDPGIIMNLKGDNVYAFNNPVGELSILSKWDQINKRFNLLLTNRYMDQMPLNISGYYEPNTTYLKLNVSLKEFALIYFEPVLRNIIEPISGSISGDLFLEGPLNRLNLTSNNSRFNDFNFVVDFTKVPYTLNGPFNLNEDGIRFKDLSIKDKFGKLGVINGGLNYRFFKNMYLDTKISFRDFHCLNTKEKDNRSFYGNAIGSGIVHFTGPFNKLLLDIDVITKKTTNIHIPLSGKSSASKSDLLKFTNTDYISQLLSDDYKTYQAEKIIENKKKKSELEVKVKLDIDNDSEVQLELNKELGNVIKGRGNGVIEMDINPSKDIFDIKGDYNIEEGSYKFVVLGVLAKDFVIQPGGNISFNGDIMNSNLNLTATYNTKASVSTLIADTSSVATRRPIECGIKMSGALSNPRLGFSIDIDDLDPIIKGRVDGALSTDDKVLKQFMAILVSGSFIPDEQSSIVNNTTILYSNASEILANQFNNIFRQLGIPLDLGLNYQKGKSGNDVFDVDLSFQAFNNRVIINGNVGNSDKPSKAQEIVGNFEAEVKLDRKGKIRLSLFTKSADNFSNYLDDSQRNGIGFTYQNEFDTFNDLIQSIFMSKKKREKYEQELIEKTKKEIEEEYYQK